MLTVRLSNLFATGNEIRGDKDCIGLPVRADSGVFTASCWGLFWGSTRGFLGFLRRWRFNSLRGGTLTSGGGGSLLRRLMRGVNMNIVWGEVVESLTTGSTSKSALGGLLLVGFQMAIKS